MQVTIRNAYEAAKGPARAHCQVVIDIFRASSTSLALMQGRPFQILVCNELTQLQALKAEGFVVVSEVYDLGLDNSPTQVAQTNLRGKQVVLKTTNLTAAIEANYHPQTPMLISGFNNLSATVSYLGGQGFQWVEILPAGQMQGLHPNVEDSLYAQCLKHRLEKPGTADIDLSALTLEIARKCTVKQEQLKPEHYPADLQRAIQFDLVNQLPFVQAYSLPGCFQIVALDKLKKIVEPFPG